MTDQVQLLEIKVESFVPASLSQAEADTSPAIDVKNTDSSGKLEFLNAHFSEDDFGKIVLVYFNFTNTGDKEAEPIMNRLWFSLGEDGEYMTTSIMPRERWTVPPQARIKKREGQKRQQVTAPQTILWSLLG